MELLDDRPLRMALDEMVRLAPAAQLPIAAGFGLELVADEAEVQAGNCFAFALDLTDALHTDPAINHLAVPDPILNYGRDVHPDGCFVRWLWVNRFLQPHHAGRVWLYFDGGRPVHAAKRDDDGRAVSKWGGGHLWRHAVDDVPRSYGSRVASVALIDPWTGLTVYREYLSRV